MEQTCYKCKFFEDRTYSNGYCNLIKDSKNKREVNNNQACCHWESALTGEARISKLEAETEAQVSAMNILHHKHAQEIEELKSSIFKLEIINENKWRLW